MTTCEGKREQVLPEGWRWVKLGDVASFKNGINFTSDQKGKGIPTVDVLNMYSANLFIRMNDLYRIDVEPKKDYLLRPNDVLFVRSSVKREGVGWTSICPSLSEPTTFCGFVIRARITTDDQQVLVESLENRQNEFLTLEQSLQDQLDIINALPAALLRQAFNGEL